MRGLVVPHHADARKSKYYMKCKTALAMPCIQCKNGRMQTFSDFCTWIGSQRRAADALGISESNVSRLVSGKLNVSPEIAERVEQVSHGLFRKERVLWPESVEKNKAA